MTTDMLPTDDAPNDAPVGPRQPRRHSWVAILVALIGGVVIIGMVVQAIAVGVNAGSGRHSATYTAAVDGVTHLDITVEAGDLTLTFADVEEASLDVVASGRRSNADWVLENDGNRLVVREDNDWWRFWPDFGTTSRTTATLVLPDELEGAVSADLEVSAGGMDVIGDLTDVVIDVSAGSLTFDGASTSVSSQVSAGEANVTTEGAETIDVQVSAGRFTGTFTGPQPDSTYVDVSAGDAIVNLPDGAYAESGEVSAGDRTIEVRTDPASPHTLDVHVSAGDATVGYSD
ncbi:hypothetical protein [Pseudactinotalea terrae]|uniref:hypothetical protein n=1 Tax=Pseudactinotalea terrae TaxID=1743262 RepID=UPI0012E1FB74|nr:hypothetical protein [Pseudactinotalea terrae]